MEEFNRLLPEEVNWEFWYAAPTVYSLSRNVETYLGSNADGDVAEVIHQIRDLEFNCFWSDGLYMVFCREIVHQWHSSLGRYNHSYNCIRPYRAWHRLH